MKPSRLTDVLTKMLSQRWPVFIWGAPGIGKSSIVKQVGIDKKLPVIDLRASLLDPTDLRGIPSIENGSSRWCPPSFLPKATDKPGILFLDEINAAPPLVQASLYQLVLDRRIGEYVLPEGWTLIAAGNRQQDKAVTFRLSSALGNRFIHIDLDTDLKDWRNWAMNNRIHPLVLAFLGVKPNLLQKPPGDEAAYPTPRSWHMLSGLLDTFGGIEGCKDLIRGTIGEGTGIEFVEFCKRSLSEASLRTIVNNPSNATLPTALDELYVLTTWLAFHATDIEILDAAAILLNRLPPEFSVVLATDILKVSPAFARREGYRTFLQKHGQLFH